MGGPRPRAGPVGRLQGRSGPGEAALRAQRLALEAEAAARLTHPNIVTLHDAGRCEQGPYLVLELLRGETLEARLERERLAAAECVRVAVEIARALAHAHAAGVAHRDLKPGNVFLCEDGRVKVLDFGMAHAFGRRKIEGGTPAFMAPEQRSGAPEDERSDVFALGVILHRMLTGALPPGGARGRSGGRPAPDLARGTPPAVAALVVAHARARSAQAPARRRGGPRGALRNRRPAAAGGAEQARAVAPRARPGRRPKRARGNGGAPAPCARKPPSRCSRSPTSALPATRTDFCEGIAEELLGALSVVDDLRVAARDPRSSSRGALDSREMGRALGVTTLLEGSVRKAGNRVRISGAAGRTQAPSAGPARSTGCWRTSSRSRRRLRRRWRGRSRCGSPSERQGGSRGPARATPAPSSGTSGPAGSGSPAHASTSRARARPVPGGASRWTRASPRRTPPSPTPTSPAPVALPRRARRRAPPRGARRERGGPAARSVAGGGARRAGKPPVASAGRPAEAEEEFRRATTLNPGLAAAWYFQGRFFLAAGRMAEGALALEEAARCDPEDYNAVTLLPQAYRALGDRAREASAVQRAAVVSDRWARLNPDDVRALYCAGGNMVRSGRGRTRARARGACPAARAGDFGVLYNSACTYAIAGDADRALELLDRAVRTGGGYRSWIEHDSDLDPLQRDPRFQAILARLPQ